MAQNLTPIGLARLAVSDFSTTPVPPNGTGSVAWSTTLGTVVEWNGTYWRQLSPALPTASMLTEVTATTTADATGLTLSMPANSLSAGATFVAEFSGTLVIGAVGAMTLATWLKIGSTKVATISPVAATVAGTYPWSARYLLTFRAVGSSGVAVSSGFMTLNGISQSTTSAGTASTTAVNTTASVSLSVGSTLSSALLGNSSTIELARITQVA